MKWIKTKKRDNEVNGTQSFGMSVLSGTYAVPEQQKPGRHQVTAKGKWTISRLINEIKKVKLLEKKETGTV